MMQAALMAQAALARGQAQAQAAMMLNSKNIQAMAEQMGIRKGGKNLPNNPNTPPARMYFVFFSPFLDTYELGTMYEDKHTPLLSANLYILQIMVASP